MTSKYSFESLCWNFQRNWGWGENFKPNNPMWKDRDIFMHLKYLFLCHRDHNLIPCKWPSRSCLALFIRGEGQLIYTYIA